MHWLLELVIRYRLYLSLAATTLASLLMLSSPPATQAKTARVLTMSLFYPLQITVAQVTRAKNIYAENSRLKIDVALLSAQIAGLREQGAENERLRAMLGFEQDASFDLIPVRVVARDPSPFFRSVVVNAGKDKGVHTFMPVVGERGIAGKVVCAMGGASLVQLLNDPLNRTSIMVRRSRAVSILETQNGSDYFARFRIHEDVREGDSVITSGLGGIYPRGFAVGVVDKVLDEHDPLFKKTVILPSLDIKHLEELFIVRLEPRWSALKEQIDSLNPRN